MARAINISNEAGASLLDKEVNQSWLLLDSSGYQLKTGQHIVACVEGRNTGLVSQATEYQMADPP